MYKRERKRLQKWEKRRIRKCLLLQCFESLRIHRWKSNPSRNIFNCVLYLEVLRFILPTDCPIFLTFEFFDFCIVQLKEHWIFRRIPPIIHCRSNDQLSPVAKSKLLLTATISMRPLLIYSYKPQLKRWYVYREWNNAHFRYLFLLFSDVLIVVNNCNESNFIFIYNSLELHIFMDMDKYIIVCLRIVHFHFNVV